MARGLPLQLEWIIEKALEKDPNLRYQTIADLRVDLQRLKIALESGRLTSGSRRCRGACRRRRHRTRAHRRQHRSRRRSAACRGSRLAIAVAAAIVLGVAMSYYHLARPGADLPLQLPEGGVLTKARDTVAELRLFGPGLAHERLLHRRRRRRGHHRRWPACPRRARRFARARRSRTGARASRTPPIPSGGLEPAAGDFSVRLDPKGQLVAFATGYATDGAIAHADRGKATSIGLEAIKKSFGIDASGYELEVVERSFPAGKTELTWRSPALKYGHVEQMQVNLQGERLILIERSFAAAARLQGAGRRRWRCGSSRARARRSSPRCS